MSRTSISMWHVYLYLSSHFYVNSFLGISLPNTHCYYSMKYWRNWWQIQTKSCLHLNASVNVYKFTFKVNYDHCGREEVKAVLWIGYTIKDQNCPRTLPHVWSCLFCNILSCNNEPCSKEHKLKLYRQTEIKKKSWKTR